MRGIEITVVCPLFNEEEVVEPFLQKVWPILQKSGRPFELLFINDGSQDQTLEKLLLLKRAFPAIRIINFSRNFGKEAALTAGIDHAKGDAVIFIDADLQHPPEIILDFIKKWKEGYDVVAGKRKNRPGEHFLRKVSSRIFYKLQSHIADVPIPEDVGDFRLISRKVVEALKLLPENQRFMKGIFAWVGFKTTTVEYYQEERHAGKTTFNGWRLWNFAWEGITSFSTFPLRVWFYIGFFVAFIAFLLGLVLLLEALIYGIKVPGYVSTITMILFLGGIQLIGIGILGEYIGRIYKEAKRRPTYIVESEY